MFKQNREMQNSWLSNKADDILEMRWLQPQIFKMAAKLVTKTGKTYKGVFNKAVWATYLHQDQTWIVFNKVNNI